MKQIGRQSLAGLVIAMVLLTPILILTLTSQSGVVTASPDTFGYETPGGSNDYFEYTMFGSVFTAGANGTADNITVYLINDAPGVDHQAAIYKHSDNSKVGETEVRSDIDGEGWWTFDFASPPSLSAGVAYVLVIWSDGGQEVAYDAGDTDQGHSQNDGLSEFPATATFTHNNNKYSIYCSYTVAAVWSLIENWTGTVQTFLLTQPQLYSPSDGATITDNTTSFEWTYHENADNHRLLVDNDADFSSPEDNVLLGATDNSWTKTGDGYPDDNYSWKVVATNTQDENESPVWTFNLFGGPWKIPTGIISHCGESGAFVATRTIDNDTATYWAHALTEYHTITFDLGASYTVQKIRLYQYATEANRWGRVAGLAVFVSENIVDWGDNLWEGVMNAEGWIENGNSFEKIGRYIKLVSYSNYDSQVMCEFQAYATERILPSSPVLYLPSNDSTVRDRTPYFEWTLGATSDNHRIEIDNDSDFGSVVDNENITEDNFWNKSGFYGYDSDNYYWRVVAVNEYGETISDNWTFELLAPSLYIEITHAGDIDENDNWVNNVRMPDNQMLIKVHITPNDVVVENVILEWYDNGTWENYEMADEGGDNYENTRNLENERDYSFNILLLGSGGEEIELEWLRVDNENNLMRRYIRANYATVDNLEYDQFYFHDVEYNLAARSNPTLEHEQMPDGSVLDTNYMQRGVPTTTMYGHCDDFVLVYMNENLTISDGTVVDNIYYYFWWYENFENDTYVHLYYSTYPRITDKDKHWYDNVNIYRNENKKTYPITGLHYGQYILNAGFWDLTADNSFNSLNIYNFSLTLYRVDDHDIEWISKEGLTSYIIINLPDNSTLAGMDSDSDGWDDNYELYTSYTNPFQADTDADGIDDSEDSDPLIPQAVLYLPENNANIDNHVPYFEWLRAANVDNHRLLIDDDSNFLSPNENRVFTTENSYTIPDENALPEKEYYYWKVVAEWLGGSSETETWTFQVPHWRLAETWTVTILAYAEWNLITIWTGTVEVPASWTLTETWSGTINATTDWASVEEWNATVTATTAWTSVETWTGSIETITAWTNIETWTGTAETIVAWQLVETWTATLKARAWILIETWSGTITAGTEWTSIETWTAILTGEAEWTSVESWTGITINAVANWSLIEEWTGILCSKVLEVRNKSLTGNQDNATIIVEIGYDDNSALVNMNAQLWLNNAYVDNENVNLTDNLITFTGINLPDNTDAITIKLENVKTSTSTWISENLLFTENTTASFTIDDATIDVYLDDYGIFTGTIASKATYVSLNITAYLKYGGTAYDNEDYTDNENWSLTAAPTASTVYDVEMYENVTLMWSTPATIYVSTVGPGGGGPGGGPYIPIPPPTHIIIITVVEADDIPTVLENENWEGLEGVIPLENVLIEGMLDNEVVVWDWTDNEGIVYIEVEEGEWTFRIGTVGYEDVIIEDRWVESDAELIVPLVKEEEGVDGPTALLAIVIGMLVIGIVVITAYLILSRRIEPIKRKEEG